MASYKSLLRNFAPLDHSQNEMKIKEKILVITDSYSFYFLWMNAIPDKRVSRKVDEKCILRTQMLTHFSLPPPLSSENIREKKIVKLLLVIQGFNPL